MNKLTLIGKISKEPKKYDGEYGAFSYLSVKTSATYMSKKTNQMETSYNYISVAVPSRLVDYVVKDIQIGDLVCVEASVRESNKKTAEGKYENKISINALTVNKIETDGALIDEREVKTDSEGVSTVDDMPF